MRKTNKPKTAAEAIASGGFAAVLNPELPDTGRMAMLLDWAAREYPYDHIPHQFILQGIRGFAKTPAANNKDVMLLRGKMSRVKQILMRDYGRTMVSLPGVGPRATVDGLDIGETQLTIAGRRMKSAIDRFDQTRNLIDEKLLPATPQGNRIRNWLTGDAKQAMRMLTTKEFTDKLQPATLPPEKQ